MAIILHLHCRDEVSTTSVSTIKNLASIDKWLSHLFLKEKSPVRIRLEVPYTHEAQMGKALGVSLGVLVRFQP